MFSQDGKTIQTRGKFPLINPFKRPQITTIPLALKAFFHTIFWYIYLLYRFSITSLDDIAVFFSIFKTSTAAFCRDTYTSMYVCAYIHVYIYIYLSLVEEEALHEHKQDWQVQQTILWILYFSSITFFFHTYCCMSLYIEILHSFKLLLNSS